MDNPLLKMPRDDARKILPVILKEYSPEYKEWYEIEKQNIICAVGEANIARINHFGSSAIEGLVGKPVIDISLEVDGSCDIPKLIENLEKIGWQYMHQEDPTKPMRIFLIKGYSPDGYGEKLFHMHIRYLGNWHDFYLKEYLIAHPDIAAEYGKLKQNILENFENNISILEGGYGQAKDAFLEKHTNAAMLEFKDKYKPKF